MKKVFIISAVLLLVVLIFLGIYNFAFKKEVSIAPQATITPTTEVPEKNVPIKKEKIKLISNGAVIGPVVDKKTEDIKYYDSVTGLVWQVKADGTGNKKITNSKVPGLKKVVWSPENTKVLTIIQNEGGNIFSVYDYQSQKASALNNKLEGVAWDNTGTKIFYKYFDVNTKKGTVNIANPDGSNWQKIADTEIRYISIAPVPLSPAVSFWNTPDAFKETQFQIVSVTGGESKKILAGKYGADYLWSPDGSKALVSSLIDKTMTLGLVSVGGEYQELGIPTIASKCAWSQDGKIVYYALAGGIPDGAIMPNDYQENKFNTKDTFWKINIATGEKERIVEISEIRESFDVTNLFLSASEDALFFINKVDKKLYRVEL